MALRARRPARAESRPPALSFHPLTAERWPDLVQLFGPRGACGGCWCMFPRLRGEAFRRGTGASNQRALHRIVEAGEEPGILAYAGGEPVGWCALAPRETYPRIVHSRLFQPVDDRPVWSVVCFFVAKEWRRHGLTPRLLEAAAAFARRRGATTLEGYPVAPRSSATPDAFAWHGVVGAFTAAGFREVARPSPSRRIMRLELKPTRRRARASRG